MKAKIFLIINLLCLAFAARAATINGPSTASPNDLKTYTINTGYMELGSQWVIVGGTQQSSSQSGTTYSVVVKWTSSGSVSFKNQIITHGSKNVTVSSPVLIAGSIGNPQTLCQNGNPSSLTNSGSASSGTGNYTYTWQKKHQLTGVWENISGTNSTTYNPPSLFLTTEYRRKVSDGSSTKYSNVVQVTINPAPGLATGSNKSRCATGAVTLTASPGSNGNTIRWYSAASGGTLLKTGTSYTTPSLSSSKTYYAASYNSSTGCVDTDRKAITAVINPLPGLASGSNKKRCSTGAVTLTASSGSNGNTIRWYSASSGGTLLKTGTSYTTPSLSSSKTYYAASYHSVTGCQDGDRKAITAVINPIPSLASGSNNGRCSTGVVTLTASPGSNANTIRWYATSTGGSVLKTGTSYTTPSLSSSKTYYAASYHSVTGCQDGDRKAITAVINPIPGLASGSNNGRCSTGVVTLTASPGSNANTIRWYAASSGGSVLKTGTSYTTPSLSSSKTYYAASYHSVTGCQDGDRKAIAAVINPIPGLASGNNTGRCSAGTVILTASPGSNATTIRWYAASTGGSVLKTGTSYTTPNLNSSTTYYAASYNSSTGCQDGDRKAITAVINPIPGLASGSNTGRCSTGTVNLTASPGSNATTIRWYAASSGGSVLKTGTSYTTPSLSSSTTYYAASYNNSTGCMDNHRKAITAVINPIPSLASGSNNGRCSTGVVTLTASPGSNANTIRWYAASSGGSVLKTGTSYTTPSLSSSKTYYAASYHSVTGCQDGDRKAITAVINPIPGLAIGSNNGRCSTGAVTLTASPGSNANSIRWYAASTGGSVLKTGTSYTTPSLSSSKTYYAASYNSTTGCLDGDRKAITAVINPIPSLASGSNNGRCSTGVVTLTASPGSNANSIRWYAASSGGSVLKTGTSYTTPSLSSSKTYYAASYNSTTGCLDGDRKAITAVINPIPGLASGSNNGRCSTGVVTLTASPGSNANTIRWYAASTGGSILKTGTSYTTPSLSSSKTYYAASYHSVTGCQDGDRKAITAVINPIPSLASGNNNGRCSTGVVTLTASPGSNANTIRWYAASSGGSILKTGTSYTTPSLSSSKTYYAASYNSTTGCLDGDRKAITAVINPIPGLASGSNNDRCSTGVVTLTASPGSNANSIRWYAASTGGSVLKTGTSYTTPSLSSSKTYYAASYNSTTGCLDGDRKAIAAVINPIPGLASGSNKARCATGTVTLSASTGSNANAVRWYSAASGGILLKTGTSYTTPILTSSTTYYAASYHSVTGCEDVDRKAITAVINPIPGLAVGSDQARCGNGIVTLTASSGTNGNTVRWYATSTGGASLFTGVEFQTPVLTAATTTYYAASFNSTTGCEDSDRKAISALVDPVPTLPTGSGNERCGNGVVTLQATPGTGGNNVRWYATAAGGSVLHTGTSFNTPSINSSTTYYAASFNSTTSCQGGQRAAFTAVINPIPDLPSASDQSVCGIGPITLTASPSSGANSVRWYAAASGGTPLFTGLIFDTPNLPVSTTYYAASYNSSTGCEDPDRRAVAAVKHAIPGLATGGDVSRCGNGPLSLTASLGSDANAIRWYSAATGGTLLYTGSTYVSNNLTTSTTFYAVGYNSGTGCEGASRTAILAEVHQIPSQFNLSGGGSRCVGSPGFVISMASELGVNYQLLRDGTNVGSLVSGVDGIILFGSHTTAGVYTVEGTNASSSCSQLMSGSVTIETNPVPTVNAGTDFTVFQGSGVLTLTGYSPVAGSWSGPGISGGNFDPFTVAVGDHVVTYTYTIGSTGCSASDNRTITVLMNPEISFSGSPTMFHNETKLLSVPDSYTSYQWKKGGTNITGAMNNIFEATEFGVYTVTVTHISGAQVTTSPVSLSDGFYFQDQNFVKTTSLQVPHNESNVDAISGLPKESVKTTINYMNGLGRGLQTIQKEASPNGKDIVLPMKYDAFGRNEGQHLAYVSTTQNGIYQVDALTNGNAPGSSQFDFYQSTPKVAQDTRPFTENVYEASPLSRVLEQYGVGQDWKSNGKSVKTKNKVNRSWDSVRLWTLVDQMPVSSTNYPQWTLRKVVTVDEDGGKIIEYADKQGRTVLKRVKEELGGWADTYYVYDDLNNLRYVMPPMMTQEMIDGANFSPDTNMLDRWAFQYKYDGRQRMIEKKVPGAGWVYMIYDLRDRVILAQDANQRLSNQWTFTKYDHLDRPVFTGLYINQTLTARDMIQSVLTNGFGQNGFAWFESRGTAVHGYDNLSFPRNPASYLTVAYYDDYDFPHAASHPYTAVFDVTNENQRVKGQVTGTKVINLADSTWLTSVSYYDDRYRLIQSKGENHLGGSFTISNKYDFVGKVQETMLSHHDGVVNTNIHRTFEYDHLDRLLSISHSIDGAPAVMIVQNEYNAIGELVDKKLHSTDNGTSFMQSVDYRYNIRGWLTSMNNTALEVAAATNDDANDLFGFELSYNTDVSGLNNTKAWSGNISAMTWSDFQSVGSIEERGFSYEYDRVNRLVSAQHHQKSAASFAQTTSYSVSGLNYDLNGNINGLLRNNANGTAMDNLSYGYGTGASKSNQLQKVTDTNGEEKGFKDGADETVEYSYDANGNMVTDMNKGIVQIDYNLLNLPAKVDMDSGNYLAYAYDAAGTKLQQKVYEDSVLKKTTDYSGEFIYETDSTGVRKLTLIQQEEGRIIPEANGALTYQYHLKDHLGNVRTTFTSGKYVSNYLTTMEDSLYVDESLEFNNLQNRVVYPVGGKAVRLNRSNPFGPSIGLSVSRGDTVAMSVKAYYENTSGFGNSSLGLGQMTALIAGAFGAGGLGTESQSVYDLFNVGSTGPAILGGDSGDDALPSAYLNYLIFDDNDVLVESGFFNVHPGANLLQTIDVSNLIVNQAGYIYVYLSNESDSDNPVYFDDFMVSVDESPVLETQDYYPFGLSFNEYNKLGMIGQRFKYNGKEEINDLGFNLYDYNARLYDPALVRFTTIDSLSEKYYTWSPYNYVGGNPIKRTDKDGKAWNLVVGALIGGTVEYASQVTANYVRTGKFDQKIFTQNIDFADIGISALAGAGSGGLSALTKTFTKSAIKGGIATIGAISEVPKSLVDVNTATEEDGSTSFNVEIAGQAKSAGEALMDFVLGLVTAPIGGSMTSEAVGVAQTVVAETAEAAVTVITEVPKESIKNVLLDK